jgi:uncharacterized membrane protein
MSGDGALNSALRRNIDALRLRRAEDEARSDLEERLARAITRFAGSMRFVYVHGFIYGAWIIANLEWVPDVRP